MMPFLKHLFGACMGLLVLSPGTVFAATLSVVNLNDSGAGSLRQTILEASPGDTVVFAVAGTITLTSGGIDTNKSLTITGPGADLVSISGNSSSYVFTITWGTTASISGITIFDAVNGITHQGALLVLSNAVIRNTTGSMGAGIIACSGTNSLTVMNSTFADNVAANGGGAIAACSTINISGSTFAGNRANYGGAIDIANTGTVTITNSTFYGNTAILNGGAIRTDYDGLSITNSTFSANSAPTASAFYIGGYPTISPVNVYNTIFASGTGGGHCNVAITGANTNNLDYGDPSANSCNAAVTGDPRLGPLALNGGPTQTMALLVGSAAMDAGDNASAPGTDQRGVTRPRDGDGNGSAIADIGAFEFKMDAVKAVNLTPILMLLLD